MVKHYIVMSSSYTDGIRVALDITDTNLLNSIEIGRIIQHIKNECGKDVPLSTHLIETMSDSWASVKEYDPFFEDVQCTKSVMDFATKIKLGRTLSGLDVAAYILSKIKCTHLSLEKFVYFAYADYLCDHKARLFKDKIYAFTYGPVVESVYKTYKRNGYDYVEPFPDDILHSSTKELPAKSRILFAYDGAEKLHSIDQTLERYGQYSARQLVQLTHQKCSPWSMVDSSRDYQPISDELIMEFHHNESPY